MINSNPIKEDKTEAISSETDSPAEYSDDYEDLEKENS